MPKMTAAEAAIRVLESEGVDLVFGQPGAAILPFYQAMRARGTIRHVLVRHEEGGTHAAEGYSRASGQKIGVSIGTSGAPPVWLETCRTWPIRPSVAGAWRRHLNGGKPLRFRLR